MYMYIGAMNRQVHKSSLKLQSMQLLSHYSVQTNTEILYILSMYICVHTKAWEEVAC